MQTISTRDPAGHSHDAVAARGGFPDAARATANAAGSEMQAAQMSFAGEFNSQTVILSEVGVREAKANASTTELLREAKQFLRSG